MKDMRDQFISYEIAVRMKELEFDEPCLTNYCNEGKLQPLNYTFHVTNSDLSEKPRLDKRVCTAPLCQQTIDWLREKHGMLVIVDHDNKSYFWCVIELNKDRTVDMSFTSCYTYQETLVEGINYALKLIEDEKNK